MKYRSFLEKERSTVFTYRSLVRKKRRSNHEKKGRRKNTAFSAASCPAATGLSRVAQRTGDRINATTTDRSMEEMRVTENCR